MNIPSTQSGHWTDDELLAFIYGVGPSGNHLDGCSECRTRLASMQANRESVERSALTADGINPAFLAAQRRGIYQRMEKPAGWSAIPLRRWAAGVATTCVLCASLVVYQHNREAEIAAQERINDARLAQEVATMAQDTDVSSMAPLEGLFE